MIIYFDFGEGDSPDEKIDYKFLDKNSSESYALGYGSTRATCKIKAYLERKILLGLVAILPVNPDELCDKKTFKHT